jgi:hypothetical protein
MLTKKENIMKFNAPSIQGYLGTIKDNVVSMQSNGPGS